MAQYSSHSAPSSGGNVPSSAWPRSSGLSSSISPEVYEGYHFPSDVIGSIVLGLVVLYLFHAENAERPVARVLAFAQQRAAWFYLATFVVTYQIATLFDDLREIGRGFSAVLLHHDVFNGS